jgi:RNA polymerase sigma factor (sigma-70 family)
MIVIDPVLLGQARSGSRTALSDLARAIERPIFNLAMRMLAHRADAEDATQEILVQVITHLGDIRDEKAAGAWAFRLACRHLVHTRRQGAVEAQRLSFRAFAADLGDGLADIPDNAAPDPEFEASIREVKIGCTLALLTCLTRALRAAYILGDVLELTDAEASEALEIEPAAYRQRLRRARMLVSSFVKQRCGIVAEAAPCRCTRRVPRAIELGRVAPGTVTESSEGEPDLREVEARVAQLDEARAAAALMRSNPDFASNISELVMAAV